MPRFEGLTQGIPSISEFTVSDQGTMYVGLVTIQEPLRGGVAYLAGLASDFTECL